MFDKKDFLGYDMKNPADGSQPHFRICGGRGLVENMCKSVKGCEAYTL